MRAVALLVPRQRGGLVGGRAAHPGRCGWLGGRFHVLQARDLPSAVHSNLGLPARVGAVGRPDPAVLSPVTAVTGTTLLMLLLLRQSLHHFIVRGTAIRRPASMSRRRPDIWLLTAVVPAASTPPLLPLALLGQLGMVGPDLCVLPRLALALLPLGPLGCSLLVCQLALPLGFELRVPGRGLGLLILRHARPQLCQCLPAPDSMRRPVTAAHRRGALLPRGRGVADTRVPAVSLGGGLRLRLQGYQPVRFSPCPLIGRKLGNLGLLPGVIIPCSPFLIGLCCLLQPDLLV
mmetsp:Transcript_26841/g.75553  ORF Transcript_26841/g.75553 Transcript_26841/m.75553 type:complete len:290 (+) Transcript_26841:1916-2785(+)